MARLRQKKGHCTMDVRQLQYALALARTGSFSRAAEELDIAQPSLSQQMGKLEKELGMPLFFRGHGGVTPTPDGVRFLEQAGEIVRLHDDLTREMRERSVGIGQELVVGAPAITGGHVLPPLLRSFYRSHPGVRVRLVEETTDVLQDLTARGVTDLSVLALPVEDARLATRPMLTEDLLLAGPREPESWLPVALGPAFAKEAQGVAPVPVALRDLAQAPFILLKQGYGFRRTVLELCAESGFSPRVAYETSSVETAQSLAAHGLGVTLVPAMVARRFGMDGPYYARLQGNPTRTLVFAYRSDRYLRLAARALLAEYDTLAGL